MQKTAARQRLVLAHHRLVGRALRDDPALSEQARGIVDAWESAGGGDLAFVEDWRLCLQRPVDELVRLICSRSQRSERLRGSSPFALIPSRFLTRQQAHRFWNAAAFHATFVLERSAFADYRRHLCALGPEDRRARFGRPVNDNWVENFVEALHNDPNVAVIGHYNQTLDLDGAVLIGLANVNGHRCAEVGLSVLPEARQHGLGYHLLERALLWSRNHRAERFFALCSEKNSTMLRLASLHGMHVSVCDDGIEGIITIHPLTRDSVCEEIMEEQIGTWDFQIKAHRQAFSFVFGGIFYEEKPATLRRFVKLIDAGRLDIMVAFIVAFRYVMIRFGYTEENHASWLCALRRELEPLVAAEKTLRVYISGLPTARPRQGSRSGVGAPTSEPETGAGAVRMG